MAKPKKTLNQIKAMLLTSVSHLSMSILLEHFMEEERAKTERFMEFHKAGVRHRLMATLRGRPFLPMFHAGHKIKPDNWNEGPLVQS